MSWWQVILIGGAVGFALQMLQEIRNLLQGISRQLEAKARLDHPGHDYFED